MLSFLLFWIIFWVVGCLGCLALVLLWRRSLFLINRFGLYILATIWMAMASVGFRNHPKSDGLADLQLVLVIAFGCISVVYLARAFWTEAYWVRRLERQTAIQNQRREDKLCSGTGFTSSGKRG